MPLCRVRAALKAGIRQTGAPLPGLDRFLFVGPFSSSVIEQQKCRPGM
jgi:hypothetical protein